MNRATLIARISARTNISPRIVSQIMAAAFAEIVAALVRGERVSQTGFGAFTIKERGSRKCFLPSTGEHITLAPRRRVSFQPGKAFIRALEAGPDQSTPE